MAAMSPVIMLDAIKRERERRAAEGSLMGFAQQAWGVLEPGTEYHDGWHLHAIAEHLESVLNGESKRLIINVPPRHSKSLLTACFFPVYAWLENPSLRWLFATYAASLSVRDSLKCRRLIQSAWFQERWGHLFTLAGDQNVKTFFENDKAGYRFATSVGAATTGHGGDILVVDDPHNSIDAQSDAIRESTLDWWSQAMTTRFNNPKTGAAVIVMQRLHAKDLTGFLLAEQGWDHLMLPAEFEKSRRCTTAIGWHDPRTEEGELLWPEHFGRKELDTLKTALGSYGAAGQLQQRPSPPGGGILKTKHFQLWPAGKTLPDFDQVVQSWDTAFTEATTGDPSACSVWGAAQFEGKRIAILLDYQAERMTYPVLKKKVISDWGSVYGEQERHADFVLVEKKASGQSIIQDLQVAGIPVRPYNPGRADKVTRAHMTAPILETDVIYVMESNVKPGRAVSWAQPFIDTCELFPNDEHDDGVDTFTQCMIYFRDAGFIASPSVDIEEEDEQDEPKQKRNPYGR